MEKDLRASLIASGAAALLSVVVGLIARVDAFTLFLRAVLGGLLFGGIVMGAFLVIRRFLPELVEGSSPAATEETGPVTGANVNIVLSGEGEAGAEVEVPPAPSRPRRQSRTETQEGLDDYAFAGESLLDDSPGETEGGEPAGSSPYGDAAATSGESEVEELEADEGGSSPGYTSVTPPSSGSRAAGSQAGGPSPRASAKGSGNGGHGQPSGNGHAAGNGNHRSQAPRVSVGIDDIDSLPDLDSLSDGFSRAAPDGGNPQIHDMEAGESPAGGSRGGKADPAMLAQAVRTLLKRDQER